jgi:8-oxo-dGTP pyrophosphatase MutT (NUDIX family)
MSSDTSCIPFVGGIIERTYNGEKQLLIQTRFHSHGNTFYNGTFEFAAGRLDKAFENVYDALAREIKEETGLTLKAIINDSKTNVYNPQNSDGSFGFRPFCCVQQLKAGRPWVGFIFRCEVEDGEPRGQEGESKDVHWVSAKEVKKMFEQTPEKLFTLETPAWKYYFDEVDV